MTDYLSVTDADSDEVLEVCPLTPAIDVIFGKWTATIVWALAQHDEMRFTELLRRLPGLSPKVLTQRLRQLVRDGLVTRTYHDESPPRVEYALTPLGRSLMPVFDAIQEWSEEHLDKVDEARAHFDKD